MSSSRSLVGDQILVTGLSLLFLRILPIQERKQMTQITGYQTLLLHVLKDTWKHLNYKSVSYVTGFP